MASFWFTLKVWINRFMSWDCLQHFIWPRPALTLLRYIHPWFKKTLIYKVWQPSDWLRPILQHYYDYALHWLSVRHRITYKLATIVYKCHMGWRMTVGAFTRCPWLALTSISGRRLRACHNCGRQTTLWSADSRCHIVPRTRTALGTRNFAVAGSLVWTSLPAILCAASVSL